MNQMPFQNPEIADIFAALPEPERKGLLALRHLIFDIAASLPEVGEIEEVLKWGQPSYLTSQTKSGTTIRLGLPKTGGFAIYTHCQTTLISDFRSLFPDDFTFEGNRAIHFRSIDELEVDKLRMFIAAALRYKLKA